MNLEIAKTLMEGAEKEAEKIGVQMVISVLDEGGNLVAVHRMGDSLLGSIDISQNKAWTSVAFKKPTANLTDAAVPNADLYGINTTDQGKVVIFGGGIPIVKNDKVIGAVGVSGGTVEQDIQVAQAAIQAFENLKTKN